MSRNPYSNLSHEELLKLLAEKDAQLEKSSTEIRTLRCVATIRNPQKRQ